MVYDNSKFNLLLDLDQTLISAEPVEEIDMKKYKEKSGKFRMDNMDGYYNVYSRPYLQEFLDYAFKNFNVSVWTAASKDYALFIVEKILLNDRPERKLDFILFSYHCDWSKKEKKSSKDLSMIWDKHKLLGYNANNTVILDDYVSDVHKCQPNNCVIAKPFEFTKEGSENDTFLKDIIPHFDDMIGRMKSGVVEKETDSLTCPVNDRMETIKKT